MSTFTCKKFNCIAFLSTLQYNNLIKVISGVLSTHYILLVSFCYIHINSQQCEFIRISFISLTIVKLKGKNFTFTV